MPERCAQSASNSVPGSSPSEDTTPRPVMTTPSMSGSAQRRDDVDGRADRADALQRLVADLHIEAVLQRLDQLDEIERVDVEVGPGGVRGRVLGAGDLDRRELLADRGQYLIRGDRAHVRYVLSCAQRAVDGERGSVD